MNDNVSTEMAKPKSIKNTDYKIHYKDFSNNINFAARNWHYYVHLDNRANEDKVLLDALNMAAGFWRDFKYSSAQTTIIFLGKIFDKPKKAFNVDKTVRAASNELHYFSKDEVRKRKVESAGEFSGLDEYMSNASALSMDDIDAISKQVENAKAIWERIEPLRHKIYAHSEILTDDERTELYNDIKKSDITDLIQILLNVSNAFWQAEYNGLKPDFTVDYNQPISWANSDLEQLIKSLTKK